MPKNKQEERQDLARDYGFVVSFFKAAGGEVEGLFNKAVKHTWSASKFIAELKDTKWFKTTSSSARQALVLRTGDPATYKERVNQMEATVRNLQGSLFGSVADPKRVHRVAELAFNMGWTEDQLVDHLVNSRNITKMLRHKSAGGQAVQMEDQLRAFAGAMGIKPTGKWYGNQVGRILKGNDTLEGTIGRLRDWSARRYEGFADDIKGGQTMEDIAAPYREMMSDLLELNPERLDIGNKLIQRALRRKGEKGNPVPMSLSEFEDAVRRDDRWMKTDNANEQFAAVTADLLQSFGLSAA